LGTQLLGHNLTSVCPQLSYSIGRYNHKFETGIGFVFYLYRDKSIDDNKAFTIRFGYRFQNNRGGIFYKVGFTPIITGMVWRPFLQSKKEYYLYPWLGLAIGYTFKPFN
jgi:hypothetical protein